MRTYKRNLDTTLWGPDANAPGPDEGKDGGGAPRRWMTDEAFRKAAQDGGIVEPKNLGVMKMLSLEKFQGKLLGKDENGEIELPFVCSTETPDRMKDTVALAGWRLGNFKLNPVVLWAHDRHEPPVAKAPEGAWVKNNALQSRAVFAARDLSPFANMVARMYLHDYLHAVSVGFQPIKWAWNEDRGAWAIDWIEQELLEYSCCPVPANPEALVGAKAAGIDLAPMVDWAERALDLSSRAGLPLPRSVVEAAWKESRGGRTVVALTPPAGDGEKADVPASTATRLEQSIDGLNAAVKAMGDHNTAHEGHCSAHGGHNDSLKAQVDRLSGLLVTPEGDEDDGAKASPGAALKGIDGKVIGTVKVHVDSGELKALVERLKSAAAKLAPPAAPPLPPLTPDSLKDQIENAVGVAINTLAGKPQP